MNLGKWDSALLKSLLFPLLLVFLYQTYEFGIPQDLDHLAGLGIFYFLFLAVYLLFSVIGWLIFGFPIHWLICKYSNGSYFLYISASVSFTVIIYALIEVADTALIYGSFALTQALIFKYYAFK